MGHGTAVRFMSVLDITQLAAFDREAMRRQFVDEIDAFAGSRGSAADARGHHAPARHTVLRRRYCTTDR